MPLKIISYSAVVSRLLANHRQIKGIEQAEMAARLGITPPSYSRIETGQTALTVDALFSIAAVLGLDVASLMREAQNVISKVRNTPEANIQMAPLARSNTKGTVEGDPLGPFVTGAALGALLGALLASSKGK